MIRKIIKISEMDTSDHIHDVMGSFLELPRYYGRNFDALFDVLTDISERTDIAIDYEGKTLREIPACALTGLRVLFDAAMVTPALRIVKPEDIAAGEAAEAVTAAEPVVESRTAVGSEVIAEVPAESEDAFESEIDVEIVIEPEAEAELDDEFEIATESEFEYEPEYEPDLGPASEPESEPNFGPASESEVESEPEATPETEPVSEPAAES